MALSHDSNAHAADSDIEFRGTAQGGFASSFTQLLAGISTANARTLTAAQRSAGSLALSLSSSE